MVERRQNYNRSYTFGSSYIITKLWSTVSYKTSNPPKPCQNHPLKTQTQNNIFFVMILQKTCFTMFSFINTQQTKCLNVCNFIKETPTHLFSCKTCENFQNIFFTEHHWWLLLNTPNHILHFSKKNKVNYIKLMKHPKTFIMRIMLLKGLLLRFFYTKIEQKVLYFSELYFFCILNY